VNNQKSSVKSKGVFSRNRPAKIRIKSSTTTCRSKNGESERQFKVLAARVNNDSLTWFTAVACLVDSPVCGSFDSIRWAQLGPRGFFSRTRPRGISFVRFVLFVPVPNGKPLLTTPTFQRAYTTVSGAPNGPYIPSVFMRGSNSPSDHGERNHITRQSSLASRFCSPTYPG